MTTNTCRFWNCPIPVLAGDSWCVGHYHDDRQGLLDDCPGCGQGKERRHSTCLDCQWTPAALLVEDHSPAASPAPQEFCVYLLKLSDGCFFAGVTTDLRSCLRAHRRGFAPDAAGCAPELAWFKDVDSQEAAESLKTRLWRLYEDDPREIARWIIRFRDMVKELRIS